MVTPNDTTTPAQPAAPRLGGNTSARLWHFRLMRAPLRSGINPAAFAPRADIARAHPRPFPSRPSRASRPQDALHESHSTDVRHESAARSPA